MSFHKVQYLVHYNGWKKTWDEWVPESKLLTINDENREKQKELRIKAGSGGTSGGGGNSNSGGGSSSSQDAPASAADAQPAPSTPPQPPLPTSSLSDLLGIASSSTTSASKPSRRPRPNYYEPDEYALDLQMSHNGDYNSSKSSRSSIGGAQKENNNANNTTSCDKNYNRRGNQCQNGGNKRSSSQKGGGGGAAATPSNSHQRTPFSPSASPAMMVVGGTSTRPIIAGASGGGTQRGRAGQRLTGVDDPKDGAKRRRVELPIVIPDTLKRILVEDWDLVSRRTHLVVIPAAVTVDALLADYLKQREALPDPCIRSEFAASLKEYFNVMLGPQLLYRFERNQFNALEESETNRHKSNEAWMFEPTKFYGAVHLLRLFVKLGSVLSYTPLNQEESRMLLDVTHENLG